MERKTADDYRRERCALLKELNALNFRIKKGHMSYVIYILK